MPPPLPLVYTEHFAVLSSCTCHGHPPHMSRTQPPGEGQLAGTNSWYPTWDYMADPSVVTHEAGHNLGLGHSGYNGKEYGERRKCQRVHDLVDLSAALVVQLIDPLAQVTSPRVCQTPANLASATPGRSKSTSAVSGGVGG